MFGFLKKEEPVVKEAPKPKEVPAPKIEAKEPAPAVARATKAVEVKKHAPTAAAPAAGGLFGFLKKEESVAKETPKPVELPPARVETAEPVTAVARATKPVCGGEEGGGGTEAHRWYSRLLWLKTH